MWLVSPCVHNIIWGLLNGFIFQQDIRFLINTFIMWERYNMTSNCEPQCKKFFVGDFFVSRIHCTKFVLIFITTLWFDISLYSYITLLWCVHPVFVPKIGIRQYHRTILWFRQNLTRDCRFTNIFTASATRPYVSLSVSPDGCRETSNSVGSHCTSCVHGGGVHSMDEAWRVNCDVFWRKYNIPTSR